MSTPNKKDDTIGQMEDGNSLVTKWNSGTLDKQGFIFTLLLDIRELLIKQGKSGDLLASLATSTTKEGKNGKID